MEPGEIVDEIDDHEIEERHVTAEQKHGDNHDQRGIGQLLIAANPLVLRFPGPRRFSELSADFAEKVFRFSDHGNVSKNQARRDSNPQPTVLETATLPIELLTFRDFRSPPFDFRFQTTDKAEFQSPIYNLQSAIVP